jgi:hypothetical protein
MSSGTANIQVDTAEYEPNAQLDSVARSGRENQSRLVRRIAWYGGEPQFTPG